MQTFRSPAAFLFTSLLLLAPAATRSVSGQAIDKTAAAASNTTRAVKQADYQVLYVSMRGNDATGVRGGSQYFATVAGAAAKARAGDTVYVLAGKYLLSGSLVFPKSVNLTGDGAAVTTLVPDDTATLSFTAATQIRGINFDASKDAVRNIGKPFIDLSFTTGSTVADCRFHGINAICLAGNAITNTSFVNLEFDHVYQPVFIDSSVGQYPGGLVFRNCRANGVIAGGFIIHSPHAYTGTDTENTVVGLSSGLDFINCSVKGAPGALAFEVWHGWTNIHFTRCTAEDCDYGFSISECDHATLTSCQAFNCVFLFENAGSHDVSFIGCVADARPTATSPYLLHAVPFGTPVVVCNGPSYAVKWVGGSIKGSVFHAFTGHGISLLGANMSSSTARIQNANDITIQGCTFNQLAGSPPAGNWVSIDCGQRNLANIVFDGNDCIGALPYACMEVYGAHAIDHLEITGNHTDGVFNGMGGFLHNQNVTFSNQIFAGNTTDNPNSVYPGNTCFPNDPY